MVGTQDLLVIKIIIIVFIIISLLQGRCLFGDHQAVTISSSSGVGQPLATWARIQSCRILRLKSSSNYL